jgi:transketolase
MPLGAAPIAYVIWDRFLRHNPGNPAWFNRDRFILSAGHGSALLYALLHLTGYDLSLREIQRFRQWGSKTPGHPEYDPETGVEATTGPLGQGFAMGVGMAISERFLSQQFNRQGLAVVDHKVYAIVSDGDLMEGISSEAASLAGTLRLGKLIYLYDDNGISIEGDTDLVFTEDVRRRFEAYGWHTEVVSDGNDVDRIEAAVRRAETEEEKPSLVIVNTHIGYGSPKQDKAVAHGEPLGPEAARATREELRWPLEPDFHIPREALAHFRRALERGEQNESQWQDLMKRYFRQYPELSHHLEYAIADKLPAGWDSGLRFFEPDTGPMATREASGQVLNTLAKHIFNLIGGSADLAPSTKTILKDYGDFGFDTTPGRNLHFGVRESAMGGILNGMALHGGVIPYGSTFLVFSDYMRPAIRLAAMMQAPGIFVFSHDSIAIGQDGPTHQPIEQMMSLRAIPGLTVVRPADANETIIAWQIAVARQRPIAIVLTRQKVPVLDCSRYPVRAGAGMGAYTLLEPEAGRTDIILIGTGSEVHLVLEAHQRLLGLGIQSRVVSMPSWEVFEEQETGYQHKVLPPATPKLAVEAGITIGWQKYVGPLGDIIGLDRFGVSAPGHIAYQKLGFTVEHVAERAVKLLGR